MARRSRHGACPTSTFDTLSVASVEFQDGPMQDVTDFTPTLYGCIDDTGHGVDRARRSACRNVPTWWGYRAVGVPAADWDVQPRPVSAVGLDDPEYQQFGESLVPTDEPVDPSARRRGPGAPGRSRR